MIVTIGLLILLNGLTGWIWGAEVKAFDSPFPNETWDVGGVAVSVQDIGTLGVCLLTVLALWAFFRFTTLGLVMRAVANNPTASRLVGVRVGWMLALGWGLAAVLGAVAGMMAAPTLFLDPTMMLIVLIYAFAAAVLGGIDSPVGAVVGGLTLGVHAQPARRLRRLRGERAQAADGASRPARRPAHPPAGIVRPQRWCEGYERAAAVHDPEVRGFLRGSPGDRAPAPLHGRVPRLAVHVRGALLHRATRAEHPHRVQRADLARPRRVHGHRRLRERTADPRSPRPRALPAGPAGVDSAGRRHDPALHDPDRRPGHRNRRRPVRHPGSAARRRLTRAGDVRDGRFAADGGKALRLRHRRRRRPEHHAPGNAVRVGHLHPPLPLLPGLGHGRNPVRPRLGDGARPARESVEVDPRRRSGGGFLRCQPCPLQDARIRRSPPFTPASPVHCS